MKFVYAIDFDTFFRTMGFALKICVMLVVFVSVFDVDGRILRGIEKQSK